MLKRRGPVEISIRPNNVLKIFRWALFQYRVQKWVNAISRVLIREILTRTSLGVGLVCGWFIQTKGICSYQNSVNEVGPPLWGGFKLKVRLKLLKISNGIIKSNFVYQPQVKNFFKQKNLVQSPRCVCVFSKCNPDMCKQSHINDGMECFFD